MRLYFNERPRTFVLTSDSHALIVRHPSPTYHSTHKFHGHDYNSGFIAKAIVEFVKKDLVNLNQFKEITTGKSLIGFLGFLCVEENIHLGFISKHHNVAAPIVGQDINVITGVEFFCLNTDKFDHKPKQAIDEDTADGADELKKDYPLVSVRNFLCNGDFFFSRQFDATSNVQERGFGECNQAGFALYADSPYFKAFLWNHFMVSELIQFRSRLSPSELAAFDQTGFLVPICRGYAKSINTSLQSYNDAVLTLINKQSCVKTGPLFGDWGCDDNGAVSNFQEYEIIIYTKQFCFSYVIVSGNVPTYWQIETHFAKSKFYNKNAGKYVSFPRSFEASQNAFECHFDNLVTQFGDVHIIKSLPHDPTNYKAELNSNLMQHINNFNHNRSTKIANANDEWRDEEDENPSKFSYPLYYTDIPVTSSLIKKYGYTATNPVKLVNPVVESIIEFGALFYDIPKSNYIGKQLGVFRIITYNSLSKAAFIAKIISQEVAGLAFRDIGITVDSDLFVKHAKLWEECGVFVTRSINRVISYSTKLHKSSVNSTKKTFKTTLSKKYFSGVVVENKSSETPMLKLLGRLQDQISVTLHNPIHDYVTKELKRLSDKYVSSKEIKLFASTFNVNGQNFEGDIKDWLFPPDKQSTGKSYDLVFIGIQEIVELNAGQMVNTNYESKNHWEKKINNTLNKYNPELTTYASLWTGQLGGVAMLVFIRKPDLHRISGLEGSYKKTGFGGVGANKGAISIRFNYSSTELCFVVSHLAAGMTNTDERHHDYKTISTRVKFSKNRKIRDHGAVIWLGDFNYRIELPIDQVKLLIENQHFSKLFEYDQLNKQMASGVSFPFFDEMEIKFPPTYKFDNGTKVYDTSEKQRIPAWTDRILYLSRKKIVKPIYYGSCNEIVFSDHRPVVGMFTVKIFIENEAVKKTLSNEIYEKYMTRFGEIHDLFTNTNNLSYLLDEINDKTLPPPSSEHRKWWLSDGMPVKVSIQELNNDEEKVINPSFPKNPFEETDQPEFIKRSELVKIANQS